jgi:hypothetical protein
MYMLAIEVESEYRSVTRSLSGWGSKGEPNAPIVTKSEVADFSRLLKLIWQSDSSMIAIIAGSEVAYFLRLLKLIWQSDSSMIAIAAGSEIADFCYGWRYHADSFGLAVPCRLDLNKFLLRWWHVAYRSLNAHRFWSVRSDLSRGFTPTVGLCWSLDRGIDCFSIAYSLDFIVHISVRANLDDRVVVDEVSIGGHVGPSIRFFVASFFWWPLETWSPSSWIGCARSSPRTTLLIVESGAQDRRRAPLFLFRSSSCAALNDDVPNRNCMPVRNFSSQIHDAMSSQGWISALPPIWRASVNVWSSDTCSRIRGNASRWD